MKLYVFKQHTIIKIKFFEKTRVFSKFLWKSPIKPGNKTQVFSSGFYCLTFPADINNKSNGRGCNLTAFLPQDLNPVPEMSLGVHRLPRAPTLWRHLKVILDPHHLKLSRGSTPFPLQHPPQYRQHLPWPPQRQRPSQVNVGTSH